MGRCMAGVHLRASATQLNDDDAGRVVVCGSHGGRYPGELAIRARVAAIVLNDAGVGCRRAGVAALAELERAGVAAATVSHVSGRIGDPRDMLDNGVISYVNHASARLGVSPGQPCSLAVVRLEAAQKPAAVPVLECEAEKRVELPRSSPDERLIVLVDSAALVDADLDRGAIVVTGSHGGLVGGDPGRALAVDAFAAVFNDAGGGKDGAGLGRLEPLNRRGIAALTVACESACIGDARSTLGGTVSAANPRALRLGAQMGQPVLALLRDWATLR
jgi:hypothetical protein